MEKKIKLGADEIKSMTLFETLTGARVKDCVQKNGTLGFLVEQGDMGLAIGKKGSNVSKAKKVLGKNIQLVEFYEKEEKFLKNLFHPVNIKNATVYDAKNEKVGVIEVNKKDKGKILGQGGKKLKIAKKFAKRHFGIKNIKVKAV